MVEYCGSRKEFLAPNQKLPNFCPSKSYDCGQPCNISKGIKIQKYAKSAQFRN